MSAWEDALDSDLFIDMEGPLRLDALLERSVLALRERMWLMAWRFLRSDDVSRALSLWLSEALEEDL